MPSLTFAQYNLEILRTIKAAVAISLILVSFSCTRDNSVKKIKIGFSQCTGDSNWKAATLEAVKREMSFYPNAELIYSNANDNSVVQLNQIKDLLSQQIDILLVSPNEAQPLSPIIEEAYNNGIPVVIIDRKVSSQLYTSFVGSNNLEIGKIAATYITGIAHGPAEVIEIIGLNGSTPSSERQKGFEDEIKKYPLIHLKARLYGNWLKEKCSEELMKLKNILAPGDIVFAQNDPMAIGAYNVYKTLGIEKSAHFIGVDGLQGAGGGMQFVSQGILQATLLNPTGGEEAIQTAFKILNKQSYNRENILPTVVIDSTDIRILMPQANKIYSQQKDIERQEKMIKQQQILYNNQKTFFYFSVSGFILVLILGSISFYALRSNRKINLRLTEQHLQISNQRNQLIEMMEKAKEATNAKVNFFTNISHEFRTPLTLILGPLEDVMTSGKLPQTAQINLKLVQKNVIRLLRLVNQLMDFRKIEHSKMKLSASQNDLVEFVTDITESFREIASKKNISLRVVTNLKQLNVWFDVNMIDKVIFNLLSNAFKFTNESGAVSVFIDKGNNDHDAIIKVSDTGVGMTQDAADRAFELFYQGHDTTFKGTGLGLALSKELTNLHHGSISVNSEKWKGSTFQVTLPLGRDHLERDEMVELSEPFTVNYENVKIYTTEIQPNIVYTPELSNNLTDQSILIIEDNSDFLSFLKYRLGNSFEIHEASNGNTGLNLAYGIVPDLIICDIILPGNDGMFITETLKSDIRTSHIPVILLTAKGSIEQQIEGMKLKADAFIVKPFNIKFLEETIKSLLTNRELLKEHYTSKLLTDTSLGSPKKIDRKFLNEFNSIIESNISNEEFDVNDICKKIGVSRIQLYRKVKLLLGYNVNDYILTVRLQKAKHMLLNEELNISEIAIKVGFSSQAYFSTVFKSKFLLTPTQYRDRKAR